MPAMRVIPDHAPGSAHALARARRSAGILARHAASRRDASPDGVRSTCGPPAFFAAAVNASAIPPT